LCGNNKVVWLHNSIAALKKNFFHLNIIPILVRKLHKPFLVTNKRKEIKKPKEKLRPMKVFLQHLLTGPTIDKAATRVPLQETPYD